MGYTAKIQHSEESFLRLSKVRYDVFYSGRKAAAVLLAMVGFFCGVFGGLNEALSMVLVFGACWALMSLELPAKRNGERLIKLAGGNFPETHYAFDKEKISLRCKDQTGVLDYGAICAIFEDSTYFYLFPDRQSGYLIPKDMLRPQGADAFREFIEKKTGLTARQPAPFWKMRAKMLGKKRIFAGAQLRKNYRGKRL